MLGLWAAYLALLEKRPLATKAVTAALLNGLGDVLAQLLLEKGNSFSWRRLGVFTLLVSWRGVRDLRVLHLLPHLPSCRQSQRLALACCHLWGSTPPRPPLTTQPKSSTPPQITSTPNHPTCPQALTNSKPTPPHPQGLVYIAPVLHWWYGRLPAIVTLPGTKGIGERYEGNTKGGCHCGRRAPAMGPAAAPTLTPPLAADAERRRPQRHSRVPQRCVCLLTKFCSPPGTSPAWWRVSARPGGDTCLLTVDWVGG